MALSPYRLLLWASQAAINNTVKAAVFSDFVLPFDS